MVRLGYILASKEKNKWRKKKVGVEYKKKIRLELMYLIFRVLEGATQVPGERKWHQWFQATVNPTSYNANLSDRIHHHL